MAIADDGESNKVTDVTNGEKIDYVSVGDRKEPNLEELSSMDLDLIIADTSRHSEIYEDLNKIAPTIVLDSIDSSYDEYIENFETLIFLENSCNSIILHSITSTKSSLLPNDCKL